MFGLCGVVGRDTNVGIATRYGLAVPGIESQWGTRLSAPVQTGPGAHSACYTMGTVSFPEVKRPGRGIDLPPPSSAEVKERGELYLYSPSGPSWPVLAWTLHLPVRSDDVMHWCGEFKCSVYAMCRRCGILVGTAGRWCVDGVAYWLELLVGDV